MSLTVWVSEQLDQLASERECWKVDVVLEALERWLDAPLSTLASGSEARRTRRRSSPTPYVMDLSGTDLTRLDGLARRAGLSRSALVRRLVQLEAGSASASDPDAT
ncbi:MAG: hypothetical protein OEY23_02525 [Acidimicrobiia bacterium]|nr:hypothetical protein [Acidimicrobiia bacterium]